MAEGGEPDAFFGREVGGVDPRHAIDEVDGVADADGGGVLTEVGLGLAAACAGREIGGEAHAHVPLGFGEEVDLLERPVILVLKIYQRARRLVVAGGKPGIEADVALPFLAEAHHALSDVLDVHLLVGGGHDVVAVEVVVALTGGLELVDAVDAEAAEGGLVRMAVLVVEGVGIGEATLGALVAEAVGGVALEEVAGVEFGLCHAAETHTPALLMVEAEDVEHRTDVELALAALVGGGDVAAGEHFAGVFNGLEFRQACEFNPHAVEYGLLGGKLDGSPFGELALVAHEVLARQGDLGLETGEEAVGEHLHGVAEVVAGVDAHLVDVELLDVLGDVHAAVGVAAVREIAAEGVAVEGLDDGEVAHEVEVDVGGDGHDVLGEGEGAVGVEGDVHAAGEAVALLVGGDEGELDAFLPVDEGGVGDVELVEGDGEDGREGAGEVVEHELDVAIVDVDGVEHGTDILVDALVAEHLVESFHTLAGDKAARLLGALAVAFLGEELAHGDDQDGCGVELGLVDVLLEEVEFAPEALAFEVGVEIVERHGEALVDVAAVVRLGFDAVLFLVVDDLPDEVDGGVVLAGILVLAFLGGNLHGAKGFTAGHHLDGDAFLGFAALDFHLLRLVAHHAEADGGVALVVGDGEAAVHVGLGADGGAVEDNLHEGDGLVGLGVAHAALQAGGDAILRPHQGGAEGEEEEQYAGFQSHEIKLSYGVQGAKVRPFFQRGK